MSRTAKNDLEVLSPSAVEQVIGDRTYVQKPLSLRGTTSLIAAIGQEVEKATASPALASLISSDLENVDVASLIPNMVEILATIPNAVPRILTVILTGKEDVDEIEYINDNCRLPQAVRILRTFIEQNEPEELIENFMVLRSTFTNAVNKAKASAMT